MANANIGWYSCKIDKKKLVAAGLIRSARSPVKLLGEGKITKKLTIIVDACSSGARKAVEKAGGEVMVSKQKQPAAEEETPSTPPAQKSPTKKAPAKK